MAFFHGSVTICSAIRPTAVLRHQVEGQENGSRDPDTHGTANIKASPVNFKWDVS